ncbi:MAG: hypothetical protein K8L99_30830 [Anaerolineae bacterium]|nr:hypothetical protein [Anaerolineae bacterium]
MNLSDLLMHRIFCAVLQITLLRHINAVIRRSLLRHNAQFDGAFLTDMFTTIAGCGLPLRCCDISVDIWLSDALGFVEFR